MTFVSSNNNIFLFSMKNSPLIYQYINRNGVWAAAATKSLQSYPTLCDPIDGSPPGSLVPGIFQARTVEWVASSFSNAWKWKVKVKSLICVPLLATTWTAAYQAPLSMGFFQARVMEWGAIAFSEWRLRGSLNINFAFPAAILCPPFIWTDFSDFFITFNLSRCK